MKMTWSEKEGRRSARYWGKACVGNLNMALWAQEQVRLWGVIKDRMMKADVDGEKASAIAHCEERIKYHQQLVEHQTGQVFVNARRAFHAAIEARDGRV